MSRSTAARKITLSAISQKRRAAALKVSARKRRAARMYAYRDSLPFMNRKDRDGLQWWSVSPTGDYHADYKIGQQYAMDFWRRCGGNGNFGLDLGEILFAMHNLARKPAKRWNGLSGIEVGFIRTIGELMTCLVGTPALITSLSKKTKKLKINKGAFKYKIKKTVDLVDLLVGSRHERVRKLEPVLLH